MRQEWTYSFGVAEVTRLEEIRFGDVVLSASPPIPQESGKSAIFSRSMHD